MTDEERNAIVRILECLLAASHTGFQKIPASFQPPGVKKHLEEASDLMKRVKAGEFRK